MLSCSVIIVSYNALPYSKICYASYKTFTHNPNVKLIWIDNNSTDGTRDWLDQLEIDNLILLDDNVGAGLARNLGAKEAETDAICFIDNDIRITQVGWINRLLRVLDSTRNVGAIAPACNLIFDDTMSRSFISEIDSDWARVPKYRKLSHTVFNYWEDVYPYIREYLSKARKRPFQGALCLEGGGTTMKTQLFLETGYPSKFIIKHCGYYLHRQFLDRGLSTWVVPSVFLFHYGHAVRNYHMIPDLDAKIEMSNKEKEKWQE